ncbi:hypothetical protein E2986_06391 [Frieseomelitta varia]|uniref:Homologous recombination OB-fold protein OB-fold domain-containing protein n=1 Tax=Frieseomelitta varia TaxID=561572 RepID=A0A833S698_9HYME|nr:uncharacterized protein LOC122536930 [Frieseomelitta varia]KAF3421248.1 hypothetical protein E2986_06391 [Frieseomelitta varia]
MFESDDWDLDQEFLNDVDNKTNKYYSQKDNQESEPKRRKIEMKNDLIFASNCDVSCGENSLNKITKKYDENKDLRKNLILGIFNKNLQNKNEFKDALNDPKRTCNNTLSNISINQIHNCKNNQLPRKNLVLGILKNRTAQNGVIKDNIKNLELKQTASKIDEKTENTSFNNEIEYQISKAISEIQNRSNSDNPNSSLFENSKQQLLDNMLKQKSIDNIQAKNDITKSNFFKVPQVKSNKKMTLVRKFPGPAGLLPDDIDSNITCISYLNNLEESDIMNKKNDSNNLSEYCSQTTKNLFTEGAWQLMLNDLPDGFLKGHDIATIKQIANMNGFNSTKIKFLAGIVEHIDYSHDNPPIVLKDFTDSIHGILHKNIPLKYPGLLECNVVVLLHDVGLLRISGTFVSNKYQILISPSSLLGIYTSKGTIERTEYMEAIFENISKKRTKTEENDCTTAMALKEYLLENDGQFTVENTCNSIENSSRKDPNFFTILNETNKNMNEPMNFDTDLSFSVSFNKITDLQNQNNFNGSMSRNLKYVKEESKEQKFKMSLPKQEKNTQNNNEEKVTDLFKSIRKFVPNASEKKCFSHNFKQTNARHLSTINISSKQNTSDRLNNIFSEKVDIDKCLEETASSVSYKKMKSSSMVRSKLLQFKNADTLTSPKNSASIIVLDSKEICEKLSEKDLPRTSSFMCNAINNIENDSDDEMLSQLDMDLLDHFQ